MIHGIDHVSFGSPDLAAMEATCAEIGFVLTPYCEHQTTNADGAVVPAGSAQRSIAFGDTYLELQTIVDANRGHPLTDRIMGSTQVHLLVFGAADLVASVEGGLPGAPPLAWERPVLPGPDGPVARFLYSSLPGDENFPYLLGVVQQMTPELMALPEYISHPNSARRVSGITVVTDDMQAVAATLSAYMGRPVETSPSLGLQVRTAIDQVVWIVDRRAFKAVHPQLSAGLGIAVVSIEVAELAPVEKLLSRSQLSHHKTCGRLVVDARQSLGASIEFHEQIQKG
ncbi:VOC family protein [Aminobacter sp. MSH1]|uniref:VOC family protein n=1 Tax=Aminobacter sp. MSH1 TaxID=374606 RepID=UPI000D3843ED|nr:VOC family protein [Aminobacter sp. MSH1]